MVSKDICSRCSSKLQAWLWHALTASTGPYVHCTNLDYIHMHIMYRTRKCGPHGSPVQRCCSRQLHKWLRCTTPARSLRAAEPRPFPATQ